MDNTSKTKAKYYIAQLQKIALESGSAMVVMFKENDPKGNTHAVTEGQISVISGMIADCRDRHVGLKICLETGVNVLGSQPEELGNNKLEAVKDE